MNKRLNITLEKYKGTFRHGQFIVAYDRKIFCDTSPTITTRVSSGNNFVIVEQ